MNRSTIIVILVAIMVGVFAGFLWWGVPTGRLKAEVQDLRQSADRLAQQLDDVQKRDRDLSIELKAQQVRLETTERDLRVEREMNSRLHLLVSQGKK